MRIKILIAVIFLSAFIIQVRAQAGAKTFRGFIDGKSIQMNLIRENDKLSGTYFYIKYGTNLNLVGKINAEGKFNLTESDQKGTKTGELSGIWKEDANDNGVMLEGDWRKSKAAEPLGFVANEQLIDFSGDAKLTTKTFSETNKIKKFEVSAEYPEISGIDPNIAAKFNELVKSRVMKSLAEFKKEMLAQTAEDLKYLPAGTKNYISVDYSVELANNDVISLQFGDSEFTGGAHPNYGTSTLNFDLKNGTVLKLEDLFKPKSNFLTVISNYSMSELKKSTGDMSDENWIKEGAAAKIENYTDWNLTKKGLMFTFDQYQVAAYAAGQFNVIIPYIKLKPLFNANDAVMMLQK